MKKKAVGNIIRSAVAITGVVGISWFIFALGAGLEIWIRLGLVAGSWVLMIIFLLGSAAGVGATVVIPRDGERK